MSSGVTDFGFFYERILILDGRNGLWDVPLLFLSVFGSVSFNFGVEHSGEQNYHLAN